MKKIVMVVGSLMAMLILVACGGNKEKNLTEPTPSKIAQTEERTQLSDDRDRLDEESDQQINSGDKNAENQSENKAPEVTPAMRK